MLHSSVAADTADTAGDRDPRRTEWAADRFGCEKPSPVRQRIDGAPAPYRGASAVAGERMACQWKWLYRRAVTNAFSTEIVMASTAVLIDGSGTGAK